jgi:signal transduction histidine kinase
MQFFTNISHEIRTPLTLITAPVEKLLESSLDNSQKKLAEYIRRNVKRLERIVNQLLELQKIENTQFSLKAREIDLIPFLREIVSLFDEKANDKNIHLVFDTNCEKLIAWIDPEKMDKVIFNLLSNAFKFTSPGGLITVSVKKNIEDGREGNFTVSVSDSGKGMNKMHLERIFERFYQIENKETGQVTGTGIGLHLSKELVEKHHGTISVKSTEGLGSTFTVTMPLGNKHLSPDEIHAELPMITNYTHENQTEFSDTETDSEETESEETSDSEKTLILIAEDDIDILNYLEDEFSEQYQIIKANNGNDAWKLAFDRIPDLIVSDIMMPGIDGL